MSDELFQSVRVPYRVRFSWPILATGLLFVIGGLSLIVIVEQGPPYPIRISSYSFIQEHNARAMLRVVAIAAICLGALPYIFQTMTRWRPRTIVVSPTAIAAPSNPLRTQMQAIPLAAVSSVARYQANGSEFLAVHHTDGCLDIHGSGMPREFTLDDLQAILNSRLEGRNP